jgi:hypothetical protein
LFLGNQIENVQIEAPENGIGGGERELALSFQHVMEMWLGEPGHER